MHGDWCDVELGQPRAELVEMTWRLGAPLPGGRIVDEDLDGARVDLLGPLRRTPEALCEREMHTDPWLLAGARQAGGQCGPERPGGPPFV